MELCSGVARGGRLAFMRSASAKKQPGAATLEDLMAMPEEQRYELIDGELVPKEAARGPHGRAQMALSGALYSPFVRRPGGPPDRPGGWWLASEVLVQFAPKQIHRPDVAGWRRERMPEMPVDSPILMVPDWVCEILSPTNASNDTVTKMGIYHSCKVPHYWLIDPRDETLAVYRWTSEGYLHVLGARRGQRVRAEPFASVELNVGMLFGDDEDA
jgi:Uma2 family endonuclease